MKLAILTNILTPYRIPLFEALHKRVDDLTILLMTASEENRLWEMGSTTLKTVVLPGFHVRPAGAEVSLHFNRGVFRILRECNPDIVLSGGFTLANFTALLYCRLYKKKYVQWAHLTLKDGAESSFLKRLLRILATRWSDGSVGESHAAKEAFIHYGANHDRVTVVPMPLDVKSLHEQATRFRSSQAHAKLKGRYGKPLLLSIGQLIPRKGYPELFAIYESLVRRISGVSLLIVGDGSHRADYEQTVKEQGWTDVHFAGYVHANQLFKYFAIADAFIFHTLYDPYGLVLAEAMASEVPVLSSVHAVSTQDLVEDGVTGFRINPLDPETSAAIVESLLTMSSSERRLLTRNAFARVQGNDARCGATQMINFFRSLLGKTWHGS